MGGGGGSGGGGVAGGVGSAVFRHRRTSAGDEIGGRGRWADGPNGSFVFFRHLFNKFKYKNI